MYERRRWVGTDRDPLITAMGGVTRCEAWDGLPRFWSMSWGGIHFVVLVPPLARKGS